jgi:hypothetical protein
MAAALAWSAVEPGLGRLLRTPYSDVRLLGAPVTRGRLWPLAGLGLHLLNGAAFGVGFDRLGGGGVRAAVAAAHAEGLALWPTMAAVDRFHPDVRDGAWPPLLRNGRVFAHALCTHTVFGVVLGSLLPARARA